MNKAYGRILVGYTKRQFVAPVYYLSPIIYSLHEFWLYERKYGFIVSSFPTIWRKKIMVFYPARLEFYGRNEFSILSIEFGDYDCLHFVNLIGDMLLQTTFCR
ncbi:hypothetical protein BH18THE2_BH18THE2_27340 [soil metagenome]